VATSLADKIAIKFPNEGPEWTSAANEFRFPFVLYSSLHINIIGGNDTSLRRYWDWLEAPDDNKEYFPTIFRTETIAIRAPGQESLVDLSNPLRRYHFLKETRDTFPAKFKQWATTLRQNTTNGPDAEDDLDGVNEYALIYRLSL
jgi:hypothetical protein